MAGQFQNKTIWGAVDHLLNDIASLHSGKQSVHLAKPPSMFPAAA